MEPDQNNHESQVPDPLAALAATVQALGEQVGRLADAVSAANREPAPPAPAAPPALPSVPAELAEASTVGAGRRPGPLPAAIARGPSSDPSDSSDLSDPSNGRRPTPNAQRATIQPVSADVPPAVHRFDSAQLAAAAVPDTASVAASNRGARGVPAPPWEREAPAELQRPSDDLRELLDEHRRTNELLRQLLNAAGMQNAFPGLPRAGGALPPDSGPLPSAADQVYF